MVEENGRSNGGTVAYQRYCSKALNRGLSCRLKVPPVHPRGVLSTLYILPSAWKPPASPPLRDDPVSTRSPPRFSRFLWERARIKANSGLVMLLKRYASTGCCMKRSNNVRKFVRSVVEIFVDERKLLYSQTQVFFLQVLR